jgi:DNA modification methylase
VFGGDPECEHIWETTIKNATSGGKEGSKLEGGKATQNNAATKQSHKSQICSKCGAWKGQMGLEPTIDQFLDTLMLSMAEVWRVLRDDGCVFVNIGDSYWSPSGSSNSRMYGKTSRVGKKSASKLPLRRRNRSDNPDIKPKSLCLIPQKFAIRCQEAGWIIRNEIIIQKVNPIPESVTDRCTRCHEQVWLLTKQGAYFWDQEAVKEETRRVAKVGWKDSDLRKHSCDPRLKKQGTYKDWRKYCPTDIVKKRNIRSVWTMPTESHSEAHFATFSSKLINIIVKAGSSPRACEFCGAPWERLVKKETIQLSDDCKEQYKGKNRKEDEHSAGRRILMRLGESRALGRDHNSLFLRTKTVGWRKTCKCKCAGTGRCVVLDPFVGIGTSVLVAEKHGRTGVGLDLSSEYLWTIALKKIKVPVQKMLELRF